MEQNQIHPDTPKEADINQRITQMLNYITKEHEGRLPEEVMIVLRSEGRSVFDEIKSWESVPG